jgi:hypothetical protein
VKERVNPPVTLSTGPERRGTRRFPVNMEVRYRVRLPSLCGQGRCINMSSTGVLFTTTEPVRVGQFLELVLAWPARLNNTVALKLVVQGRVVREDSGWAVIAIERSEFRTAGSANP